MPYHGRGLRQRVEFRRHVQELRATVVQPQSWLTFVICGVCLVVIVIIAITAHPAWRQRTVRVKASAERRRVLREAEERRQDTLDQLAVRLDPHEIAEIRAQAAPITQGSVDVYVDENTTSSHYRIAELRAEAEGRRIAKQNIMRWEFTRVAHGLTVTEMEALCGPMPITTFQVRWKDMRGRER